MGNSINPTCNLDLDNKNLLHGTDVLIFLLSYKEIKDGFLRFFFQLSSFIVFHGAADAGTNSMKCYTQLHRCKRFKDARFVTN